MIRLRRLARIAGALTGLVGVIHTGVSRRQYAWPSFDALLCLGIGMGLLLAGALPTLAGSAPVPRRP